MNINTSGGIFLLGSERSGSNLLRILVGNHSKVGAPIAPHFCDAFAGAYHNYLPLNDEKKIMLLRDMECYANHEYNAWGLSMDYEDVCKRYKLDSLIDFTHALYQEKVLADSRLMYFSKDNHNHKYALAILKDIPKAKFLYLYRDPRDHVASWLRTPLFMHTPYAIVSKWRKEQEAILNLKNLYNVDMCFVKYEDLISDTASVMTRVLNFLGLEVEEACFTTNKDTEEAKRNPLWKNLDKPILKENKNKYKDILKGQDLNLVETATKKIMKVLGYEPVTSQNWQAGNHYLFMFSQKLKSKISELKHKNLKEKEMAAMRDKVRLRKKIFAKFN